jgi:hypothetical protein
MNVTTDAGNLILVKGKSGSILEKLEQNSSRQAGCVLLRWFWSVAKPAHRVTR